MTEFTKEPGWRISPAQLIARHRRREKLSEKERELLDQNLLRKARSGAATQVGHCLEAGACPDAPLPNGDSALMLASRGGHPDTVRVLLQGWARVDFTNNDDSPITLAIAFGKTETASVIRGYLPPVLDAATETAIRLACNDTPPPCRRHVHQWINQNLAKSALLRAEKL